MVSVYIDATQRYIKTFEFVTPRTIETSFPVLKKLFSYIDLVKKYANYIA